MKILSIIDNSLLTRYLDLSDSKSYFCLEISSKDYENHIKTMPVNIFSIKKNMTDHRRYAWFKINHIYLVRSNYKRFKPMLRF